MGQHIGLDVSMEDTLVSIREGDQRVWRGRCPSDPQVVEQVIRERAPDVERVVFETGPLAVWFYHSLKAAGLPAICIDARSAKAALDLAANKTDANDADGLARMAQAGYFREVRVKSYASMMTRTLVGARDQLIKASTQFSNHIRGVMKSFGLIVPKGGGRVFEGHVRELLASRAELETILLPLLDAWCKLRVQAAELSRQLVATARHNQACQLLTTIPGVGAITASAFVAAVEEPENFRNSRCVGAWIGLTPRRYQSGEVDYAGHISRRGDNHLRSLLYEAATVILTRASAESALRNWGIRLRQKVGFKRAAVAVARKLAVIMHAMLKTGECFDRMVAAAA